MKRVFNYATAICFFLCLILPKVSSAQDAALIKVQVHHFAPWKIVDDQGRISGIDIEFLQMLTGQMGLETTFVVAPFKRGLLMMEQGKLDIMTGLLKRPEREDYIDFIDPPYKTTSNKTFYVLKGRGHFINNYEELYVKEGLNIAEEMLIRLCDVLMVHAR